MADAAILNFSTKRNNSAADWDIVSKFGKMEDMDSPERAVTPFLTFIKIQDGGRPPSWKKENRHISVAFWVIFTKFGVLVPTDSPQQKPWLHFGATTKSNMAAGRHFEKRKIAITRLPFELLSPNFGVMVDMDSAQRAVAPFLGFIKIQDGGRPPTWKKENRHISAAYWDIFAKFGVLVDIGSPHRTLVSFLHYNKIHLFWLLMTD